MKKFSKILCLVLVIVMMAGLCAVGTSAAYKDADKITYKEAVDVMSAIGVLKGDANGFRPADGLTRAEACTIITRLLGDADVVAASTFADTKGHWAESAIAYCAAKGLVNGVGNNKFDPNGALTGSAWAKMLLCAVGFDADAEGMTGASWEVAVAKQVKTLSVAAGIASFNGSATVNREQAAQMALNVADNVETRTLTSAATTITGNGFTITTGAAKAYDISEKTLLDGFTKLVKTEGVTDALNNPAHSWTYDKTPVGTYADTAALVFTAKVSADAMAKELKGYTGVTAADVAAKTGNGVVVSVFADKNNKVTSVVVAPEVTLVKVETVTTVAATKYHGAYTQYKIGDATVKVYSSVVDADKEKDTAVITGTIAKNDMVLVYTGADGKLYVSVPETLTGAVTAKNNLGVYTVGGQAVKLAENANVDSLTVNAKKDVTLYLDAYGYVMGVKGEAAEKDVYAMVLTTKAAKVLEDGEIVDKYTATVAYADGSVETLTTGAEAKAGTVVTVKYNTKTAVYDLTAATKNIAPVKDITAKNAVLADKVYGNAATKFVFTNYAMNTKTDKMEPNGTVTVVTGIANVGNYTDANGIAVDADANGLAEVVFVGANVTATVADTYVYLTGAYTTDGTNYTYAAFVKGAETEITTKAANLGAGFYKSVTNTSALAVEAKDVEYKGALVNYAGFMKVDTDVKDTVKVAANAVVYLIDTDETGATVTTLNFADVETALPAAELFTVTTNGSVTAIYALYNSAPVEK